MQRSLLIVLALQVLLAGVAHADIRIDSVDENVDSMGIIRVKINFSQPLQIANPLAQSDDHSIQATLKHTDRAASYNAVELSFDEPDRVVRSVGVVQGRNLLVNLQIGHEGGYVVQAIPQLATHSVEYHFIPEAIASAFEGAAATSELAVEVPLPAALQANAFPRDVVDGQLVYAMPGAGDRVRLGFFASETAAAVLRRKLEGSYPGTRIVPLKEGERRFAEATALFGVPDFKDESPVIVAAKVMTRESLDEVEETSVPTQIDVGAEVDRSLLEAARQAYLKREWDQAIALYTKASKVPELRMEALEKLGVVRQKNNQLAHAKSVYQQFLDEYPDTPAATRVNQRLLSLVGATDKQNLRDQRTARRADGWINSLHLSQYYRRHSLDIEGSDKRIPINAVFSDATVLTRKHTPDGFHEARVSAGHILNFGNATSREGLRVHRASWESYFNKLHTGVKLGRQSRNKSGVLGRFDGATVSFDQTENIRWNAVGGEIVRSAYRDNDVSQPFYGVSADLKFLDESLELSPFYVEQRYDGVLDRRAVGSQAYWTMDHAMITAILDYDLYHKALNNVYLTGSLDLSENWRLNGAFDIRRSPYLTTSNALIGQQYEDLTDLERDLIDMTLGDLAHDRTAVSKSVRVGIDGALNDTWSMSLDASTSHYSSTEESFGVLAIPDRDDQYFTFQLRANDWLAEDSFTSLQVRYQTSDNSDTISAYLVNRFRMFDSWLVQPRILASRRVLSNNQEQLQIRPTLRVDYRGFERIHLEAEVGYDWSTRETILDDIVIKGLYFNVGYRISF